MAHLYGMINIPTAIWIDEAGRIVRPARIEPVSNLFQAFTGLDCEPHLAALRRWVRTGELELTDDEVRAGQLPPTPEEQLARAEFALAWHLWQQGEARAAEPHFARAGELAPHDWTIRRGSMPLRGLDPMGEDFLAIYRAWEAAGRPDYQKLAAQRRGAKLGSPPPR